MAIGSKVKGITIEFDGNTTKLGKAISDINKKTRDLDKELKEVDRALKFNPGNTELLAQKQQLLGEKVSKTKDKLTALKDAQAKLDDDPAVDKTSQEYRELQREIIETESKLKHFNQELQRTKWDKVTRAGEAFKSAGQKARTAGMYISAAAAGSIVVGKKLIDLANAQNQAEAQLTEVYKSRQKATKEQTQATIDLAAAIQKEGVYGDEVILSGAKQLATYTSTTKAVDDLLPAMTNLLAQNKGVSATQEDAAAMANLFGKALNGNVGALKRAGISFTAAQEEVLKYGTEEEKVAMLAEVVHDNVGDMNQALAETDAGKLQQAKNTILDFGERLGNMLLPHLANLAKYLGDEILPVVEKIISYLEAHPIIAKVIIALTGLMAILGPVLIAIGTLLSGLGGFMAMAPMIATAGGTIGAGFTAALGPIGLVIAAIAAAIAIGVALYKHWDQVKAFLIKCWEGIKTAATFIWDGIKLYFTTLLNFYKTIFTTAWNAIKTVTVTMWEAIGNAITAPIRAAWKVISAIVEKLKNIFNFKWSLPKIELPHFSIKPKGWKMGDLLKGSIPSLGIDWYANGAIFTRPTIIGNKGFGEAGAEAALPLDELWKQMDGMFTRMADSIVNGVSTAMSLQAAGTGGDVTIPIYLYPNGPKMGEETVRMYDKYKRILG